MNKRFISLFICSCLFISLLQTNVLASTNSEDLNNSKSTNTTNQSVNNVKVLPKNEKDGNASENIIIVDPEYGRLAVYWDNAINLFSAAGYTVTSSCLYHARTGGGSHVYYTNNDEIMSKIRNTQAYKSIVSSWNSRYKTYGETSFSGDIVFGNLFASNAETDMFGAIHAADIYGSVSKGYLYITIEDTFDYKELDLYTYQSLKSLGVVIINNAAYNAQSLGVLVPYDITINGQAYIGTISYPGYYIQYGSTGSYVTLIQRRLNYLGFNCGTVDGDFGSMTKNAVMNFQRSRYLEVDGVVGPSTWNALFNS